MRYISDTLCHFVGRSKNSDDERFELLLKIINDRQLKVNLKNPDHPVISSDMDYQGERLGEVFRRCDCVCFCDIPDDMLEIHTTKYSKFGIGFSKSFLSKLGVRPMLYVPKHGKIVEFPRTNSPLEPPMDYYQHLNRLYNTFLPILMLVNQYMPLHIQLPNLCSFSKDAQNAINQWEPQTIQRIMNGEGHSMLYSSLVAFEMFLAYVKVFDETLDENDPDNYYMEREWRSIVSINFSVSDIQKVYLPSEYYKELFLEQHPDYKGDFWIFNSKQG